MIISAGILFTTNRKKAAYYVDITFYPISSMTAIICQHSAYLPVK